MYGISTTLTNLIQSDCLVSSRPGIPIQKEPAREKRSYYHCTTHSLWAANHQEENQVEVFVFLPVQFRTNLWRRLSPCV